MWLKIEIVQPKKTYSQAALSPIFPVVTTTNATIHLNKIIGKAVLPQFNFCLSERNYLNYELLGNGIFIIKVMPLIYRNLLLSKIVCGVTINIYFGELKYYDATTSG